jgi:hypothetical protein
VAGAACGANGRDRGPAARARAAHHDLWLLPFEAEAADGRSVGSGWPSDLAAHPHDPDRHASSAALARSIIHGPRGSPSG